MEKLELRIPTRIFFGSNILEEALNNSKEALKGIAIIITGKSSMRRLGYLNRLEKLLKKNNSIHTVIIFEGISPNPKVSEINAAIKKGIENNANIVFGLGGGSAIDAAKAVAVGIGAKERINDYLIDGKIPSKQTLPIVAIPTTAGTGSEISKAAIISLPEKNVKSGIRGDNIFPRIAIVDPTFTYNLPRKITRETGFDVFTHATETFISRKSNIFTEMLSLEALKIISKYLPLLVKNLNNEEARTKMSYASMLMGINLGNSSTCLPHRLQYPIGSKTDTSHSSGLASIYKSWLFHTYKYSEKKFNQIGKILSKKDCSSRADVMQSITNFMDSIGMNIHLSELGIEKTDLIKLSNNVLGSIENDPASVEKNIIQKIYITAYEKNIH